MQQQALKIFQVAPLLSYTTASVAWGATQGQERHYSRAQACKTASSTQKQPLLAGSVLHALLCAQ
jgi:hypothetical protein